MELPYTPLSLSARISARWLAIGHETIAQLIAPLTRGQSSRPCLLCAYSCRSADSARSFHSARDSGRGPSTRGAGEGGWCPFARRLFAAGGSEGGGAVDVVGRAGGDATAGAEASSPHGREGVDPPRGEGAAGREDAAERSGGFAAAGGAPASAARRAFASVTSARGADAGEGMGRARETRGGARGRGAGVARAPPRTPRSNPRFRARPERRARSAG